MTEITTQQISTAWHRQLAQEWLEILRASRLRRPILRLLVFLHNASYHLLSFFATREGIHPKHDILRYHKFFIDNVPANAAILDVGCGQGEVAYDMARAGARVTGVDIFAPSIETARKRYRHPNVTYVIGDATSMSFDQQFDAVVLSNVLEHIEHRIPFLRKLSEIAPRILIRVPMITRDWLTVFKKNEGFEYRLDNTHYIEYDEPTFYREIADAGLRVDSFKVNFGEIYAVVIK